MTSTTSAWQKEARRRSDTSLSLQGTGTAYEDFTWATGIDDSPGAVNTGHSPDVVISQVYGGGGNTGAFYANDFIELYNRGRHDVSI